MTEQPLTYTGDVTGDAWACAACGAPIDLAHVIVHRDDCQWIEKLIERGIDLAEQGRWRG